MNAPLCVNCQHCVFDASDPAYSHCQAPQNRKIDVVRNLVSGEEGSRWRFSFCTTHREDDPEAANRHQTCGAAGRWFEPKKAAGQEAA